MKNKISLICVLLILFINNTLSAHKEWVHQYMVKEAYYFLINENQICDFLDLKNHMGLNLYGYTFPIPFKPWASDDGVALGAWAEDIDDPVWGNNINKGWTPSITHFWNADEGDDETTYNILFGDANNAWSKAKIYLFGGKPIFFRVEKLGILILILMY